MDKQILAIFKRLGDFLFVVGIIMIGECSFISYLDALSNMVVRILVF